MNEPTDTANETPAYAIGEILTLPSLEDLKSNLYNEGRKGPIYIRVNLPELSARPHDLPVMPMGMMRYGKGTKSWKLLGLYLNQATEFKRVEMHLDYGNQRGAVILDPPGWGHRWLF